MEDVIPNRFKILYADSKKREVGRIIVGINDEISAVSFAYCSAKHKYSKKEGVKEAIEKMKSENNDFTILQEFNMKTIKQECLTVAKEKHIDWMRKVDNLRTFRRRTIPKTIINEISNFLENSEIQYMGFFAIEKDKNITLRIYDNTTNLNPSEFVGGASLLHNYVINSVTKKN